MAEWKVAHIVKESTQSNESCGRIVNATHLPLDGVVFGILEVLVHVIDDRLCHVNSPNAMLKPCVGCARKHHMSKPELSHTPESLEGWVVDHREFLAMQFNVTVNRQEQLLHKIRITRWRTHWHKPF
jgi:hypothetical protein